MDEVYTIYPAIGIARVGDSDEFYIGPESYEGLPILPDGAPFTYSDFRDFENRIRRQGARFSVRRESDDGNSAEEILAGTPGIEAIEWTVHLANKKSVWYEFQTTEGENGYASNHKWRNAHVTHSEQRAKMIIDPGPCTIRGINQRQDFSKDRQTDYPVTFPPDDIRPFNIETLGSMQTDEYGRLTVVGGFGRSGSSASVPEVTDYANNDGWWDDTSDGPVRAKIYFTDGRTVTAKSAYVLVAPPAYAPQIANLVTLYDTMFDTAVRFLHFRTDIYDNYQWNYSFLPDFRTHILPILERGNKYPWLVAIPAKPHQFDLQLLGDPDSKYDSIRQYYFEKLRAPDMQNRIASMTSGHTLMPYIAGDNCQEEELSSSRYLTFTQTQYFFLQQWSQGKFVNTPLPEQGPHPGHRLTEAVLSNCVGGAFSPGIEMTWLSRNPRIYKEPFRIKAVADPPVPLSLGLNLDKGLEPGDLTKFMAQPWQADFNECASQPLLDRFVWWWPAQRPLWVYAQTEEGGWMQVPWVGIDFDQKAPDYLAFADNLSMVTAWKKLGFVVASQVDPTAPRYIEIGRLLNRSEPLSSELKDLR